MKKYVTYDAGCNIWVVEPFNEKIEWHKNEYIGTKSQCEKEAEYQMYQAYRPHYDGAAYRSIFDYQ